MSLDELSKLARHELAQLNFPPANWVLPADGPDGKPMLDALVVGGGMCGQTAMFALQREGVRHIRCVDREPRGREGPWATYARMEILRSPKHLTGPDLGVAALTYRAWHEAKYGVEHWQKLHKVARLDWAAYLLWVRETAGLAVENEVEITSLNLKEDSIEVRTNTSTFHARKVVLALGRDGSGDLRWPDFETFNPDNRGARVFHSADDIDFAALKGKRIGILGMGASAFDNAGEALEAGAAQVTMFARRPRMPQVNKSKWTAFRGFQHGFSSLDDATRWRFYTYIFSEQVPPPYESVLRCEKHEGFSLRFSEAWLDIFEKDELKVKTSRDVRAFDAVIVCTGFEVNLLERPEIASFRSAIDTWGAHVCADEAKRYPEEARFPYLGDAFQMHGKEAALGRIHVFNHGSTLSHGALGGDIPGIEIGATRLAQGIARDLFLEDADPHYRRLLAHNEDEMKPTRYFVPLAER
jgi:cation diffusion facilitator CzcD-associated flavoprotein CzcO